MSKPKNPPNPRSLIVITCNLWGLHFGQITLFSYRLAIHWLQYPKTGVCYYAIDQLLICILYLRFFKRSASIGHFENKEITAEIFICKWLSLQQRNVTQSATVIQQPVFDQTTPQPSGLNEVPNLMQYQKEGNLNGYTNLK